MLKVGINGFGRIGKMFLRAAFEKCLEVRAINDPFADSAKYLAYVFQYDSVHGKFWGSVCADGDCLIVNGQKIRVFKEMDPKKIPWKDAGVEYVVECSGKYKSMEQASKLLCGGLKKVVIGAHSNDVPMFVLGVNEQEYCTDYQVVSMASCTTNCLAPLVKVVHEHFGLTEGLMTTIHPITTSQKLLDTYKKDSWRKARAAPWNIVPSSTGAATAVTKLLPVLEGRLTGMAFRVPVPISSAVDLTARLCNCASLEDIKYVIKCKAEGPLCGILGYTEEKVVSTDVRGSTLSSLFDADASIALNETFVKLVAWCDNETGYAARLVDFVKYIVHRDQQDVCEKKKKKECEAEQERQRACKAQKEKEKKECDAKKERELKEYQERRAREMKECEERKSKPKAPRVDK